MALFRRPADPTIPAVPAETRAPAAATRPLRYTTPGLPQPPEWDASAAFRIANNTVLTCVRIVGQYLARCPFRVGADPSTPHDYDAANPLARLLGPPPGGPNPDTSARRLWAWTVGQRMMAGRWAWEVEPDAQGRPVALYALPVSALTPIPSTSGAHYFDAYTYGVGTQRRTLTRDQVVYDWLPATDDWREPDPPLRAAHLDTLIAVMQSRYDYAFLKNDARPAQIVVTQEFADTEEFQAFKRQWNAEYGGPANAGRTAFLEASGDAKGSISVEQLGLTSRDAQMAERYAYRVEQIMQALGVPKSILDASGRTFDNASQEWHNFVHGTLEPLAADLADAVNMQLAPRFGQNVGWFDLSALGQTEKVDPVTASVGAPSLVQAQLMTINEARADYGLGPVADGDRFMTADEIAALRGGVPAASTTAARSAAPDVREAAGLDDTASVGAPAAPALPAETRGVDDGIYPATPRQTAFYDAMDDLVETFGQFTQDTGPDGAHYVAVSPFADEGMQCSNCFAYEGPRACDWVAGDIDPAAVCKFWTIPYPLVVDPATGQPVPPAPGPGLVPVAPPVRMTAAHRAVLAARTETAPTNDGHARRVKLWQAKDAQVRTLERDFERRMRRLFRRQERAALARLDGKRSRQALTRLEVRALADEIYDPQHWIVETADETAVLYRHIFETVADDMALRFGVDFDLGSEFASDFVAARANQLAGNVVDTTYSQIQQAMQDGIANGEGIPELAKRIEGVFEQASATRAVTIARTEVISAYNGSTITVGTIYGPDVVAGQEWLATQDARTRESHAALDGQQIRIGETFDNGLAYPGDPGGDPAETVNCRCTVVLLTPDDLPDGRQLPLGQARQQLLELIG